MKKKLFTLLMVSVIATMLFAGCSSESSSSLIESVDDKNVHAEFENAEDAGGIAYITLGEGEVPIKEIVSLLERSGYNGYYSLEWENMWRGELKQLGWSVKRILSEFKLYMAKMEKEMRL